MKQLPIISDGSLTLNLLQGLSHNYNINNTEEILSAIHKSIHDIGKNPQRLHGIRIEKMFGYIAALLGQCHFIKQEDMGFSYVTSETVIPDYRLLLKNGREIFVEVKNNHKGNKPVAKLDESYIYKILNYPSVTLDNFKIAIYWSAWRIWTLTSIKAFNKKDNKYIIKMEDAMVKNEMGMLGDAYFMAVMPLKLELMADISKANEVNELGVGNFTIKDAQIYTGRGLVKSDTNEGKIIFDLMMYGLDESWDEKKYVKLNGSKIEKVVFEYQPYDKEQKQPIISNFSSIITCKYNLITTKDGIINKLQANYEENLLDFYLKVESEKLHHLTILKLKN